MAKVWGQRTADGRYILAYNPDLEARYPLVEVSGDDGITFANMRVVHGELPPLRYPGKYKAPGPQYVRGISEWSGDGSWTDRAAWLAYSVNKEDIWVSRVPLPRSAGAPSGPAEWNTYSPKWAPVSIASDDNGAQCIELEDHDPADYARALHRFPPSSTVDVSFEVMAEKSAHDPLHIDLQGQLETRALRLSLLPNRKLLMEAKADHAATAIPYETRKWLHIRLKADCNLQQCSAWLDGNPLATGIPFVQKIEMLTSISFKTGDRPSSMAPDDDQPVEASRFRIRD